MSRFTSLFDALATKIITFAGAPLARWQTLDFSGTGVTLEDDPANKRTKVIISGGDGVTDHGALTGLADNDHPQYPLRTGSTCSGTFTWTGGDVIVQAGVVTALNLRSDSGSPNGSLSGALGDLYRDTDDGKIYRNDDGSTGWVELTGTVPFNVVNTISDLPAAVSGIRTLPTNSGDWYFTALIDGTADRLDVSQGARVWAAPGAGYVSNHATRAAVRVMNTHNAMPFTAQNTGAGPAMEPYTLSPQFFANWTILGNVLCNSIDVTWRGGEFTRFLVPQSVDNVRIAKARGSVVASAVSGSGTVGWIELEDMSQALSYAGPMLEVEATIAVRYRVGMYQCLATGQKLFKSGANINDSGDGQKPMLIISSGCYSNAANSLDCAVKPAGGVFVEGNTFNADPFNGFNELTTGVVFRGNFDTAGNLLPETPIGSTSSPFYMRQWDTATSGTPATSYIRADAANFEDVENLVVQDEDISVWLSEVSPGQKLRVASTTLQYVFRVLNRIDNEDGTWTLHVKPVQAASAGAFGFTDNQVVYLIADLADPAPGRDEHLNDGPAATPQVETYTLKGFAEQAERAGYVWPAAGVATLKVWVTLRNDEDGEDARFESIELLVLANIEGDDIVGVDSGVAASIGSTIEACVAIGFTASTITVTADVSGEGAWTGAEVSFWSRLEVLSTQAVTLAA